MSRPLFLLLLAILGLSVLAYPLYQAASNGGLLYYVNGYDEVTYLQYHYSRAVQSLTRPGQFLVTWGHDLGLSGGWINVVFDAASLVAFPSLVAASFRLIGWSPARAALSAMLLMTLPLVLGGVNPIINWLNAWNIHSGTIYWLTMPELHTPAIVRTPEPQFSLLLLAAGTYTALRLRAYWPAYVVLPFMYPFVAVPAAFMVLALHARALWRPLWPAPTAGPLVLAFLAIGAATWTYYELLVGANIRRMLIDSHLPLFSLTAAIALACYMLGRRHVDAPHRFAALSLALAPAVAVNTQMISGHIAQPNNYEQYFGTFAVALVFLFVTHVRVRLQQVTLVLTSLMFLRVSQVAFRTNQIANDQLPMTPELAIALRNDAAHTAVNDVALASVLNLVHPRQLATALSVTQAYGGLSASRLEEYRRIKASLLTKHPDNTKLLQALQILDDHFEYGGQNVAIVSINRKRSFIKLCDVEAATGTQQPVSVQTFFVR